MNIPTATINFYLQEYRDITLNTKLGIIRTKSSINANFELFEAKNDIFLVKIRPILKWQETNNFNFNYKRIFQLRKRIKKKEILIFLEKM